VSAHRRGPGLWYVSLAIGIAMLVLPAAASAAPPVCEAGPFLYDLPAGLTHANPRAPCTDADGDAITVEPTVLPHLGTLSPSGSIPIGDVRFYTANASAATLPAPRDTMTFVAHAGGETSNPYTIDVKILPGNHPPVCNDLTVTVKSGQSVHIPTPKCVDVDNDTPEVIFDKPAHGTFDVATQRYTSKAGFTGKDTITFAAVDYWDVSSKVGKVTITVTRGSGSGATTPRDREAPSLDIDAPSSLLLRQALRDGILFTARTNEAGRLRVYLYVTRKAARRFGLKKHPKGRVRVGTVVRHVVAGRTVLNAKFTRKARRKLKGTLRLTLVGRISDAAGNANTERVRLMLRKS
jgi:Big-like domain-containing protein